MTSLLYGDYYKIYRQLYCSKRSSIPFAADFKRGFLKSLSTTNYCVLCATPCPLHLFNRMQRSQRRRKVRKVLRLREDIYIIGTVGKLLLIYSFEGELKNIQELKGKYLCSPKVFV